MAHDLGASAGVAALLADGKAVTLHMDDHARPVRVTAQVLTG